VLNSLQIHKYVDL
jgi:phenylalanyl-tRNA synthetase alpha chain